MGTQLMLSNIYMGTQPTHVLNKIRPDPIQTIFEIWDSTCGYLIQLGVPND
jgi:hypothetical protein